MKRWLFAFFCLTVSLYADSWIDQAVKEEFLPFQNGISREMLESTWKKAKESQGNLFRRFRVIRGVIYGPESQTKSLLRAIIQRYPLPDVDFIQYNHDILLENWFQEGCDYAPIFASAKEVGGTHTVLFMDWYYNVDVDSIDSINAKNLNALNGVIAELNKNISRFPWDSRIEQAFWRGGTHDGFYTPQNWTMIPRGKLVFLSQQNPTLIDAAFIHYAGSSDPEFFCRNLGIAPLVSQVDHMQYKYQIDLDGTTPTYPSLHWKLFSGSLIFKQYPSPKGTLWYLRALIPWEHFVPLQPDISDLEEKIRWAQTHDAEAKRIAENGRDFALNNLMKEHILLYCYKMLVKYAALQKFNPEELLLEDYLKQGKRRKRQRR